MSRAMRLATGQTSRRLQVAGWIVCALMVLVVCGQVFVSGYAQDEGELLTYPWLIAAGKMPYRDIWMMYPPATYVLLAGLFKIGVPGLVAEHGLSLVARLCYVGLANRMLTRSWGRFSFFGPPIVLPLIVFTSGLDFRAYSWTIGLPFLLLGLLAARDRPAWAVTWFLLAATFRLEYGLTGCAVLGTIMLLSLPNRVRTAESCLAVGVLTLALTAFFLALNLLTGGDALRQIFLDPLLIAPGRSLPLFPPTVGGFDLLIELVMFVATPALIIVALVLRRPYLVATNVGVLVLLPHFIQRPDWQYVVDAAVVVVPWTILSLLALIQPETERSAPTGAARLLRGHGCRIASGLLLAVGIPIAAWYSFFLLAYGALISPLSPLSPLLLTHLHARTVTSGSHTIIAAGPGEARADRTVIDYLTRHGTRDQTVFVAPLAIRHAMYNQTMLYYVLPMRPASRYLEMNPGLETRASVQREIIQALHRCPWVVLWKQGYTAEPNASRELGAPLLQRYIKTHYRIVMRNALYLILHQQPRALKRAAA